MASQFINRRDSGVEVYYQISGGKIAVFEPTTRKYAIGTTDGEIATFFERSLLNEKLPEGLIRMR